MKTGPALAVILLLSPAIALAVADDRKSNPSRVERAETNAQRIGDAGSFLKEINSAIDMARAGDYGRLKKGTIVRIEMARDRIEELLSGHDNALELEPEERLELYNAQETITAAIRADDKNRTVCTREMVTGSRLPRTECMTVAEREARRRLAAESTDKFIRNLCTPGAESSPCSRDPVLSSAR
jgi:hypothetical protein